jgi:hypothetical protein
LASKEEIIQAIQNGIADVEATFGNMSDEQLATKVHQEEGGWTAGQVLAHLAGRQASYEMMSKMAQGGTPPQGQFDVNAWNQSHVDARAGKSRDELISEFKEVHEALAKRVEGMPDQVLQQEIMGFRGPTTVGDMLMSSGGLHSSAHAEEVRNALA